MLLLGCKHGIDQPKGFFAINQQVQERAFTRDNLIEALANTVLIFGLAPARSGRAFGSQRYAEGADTFRHRRPVAFTEASRLDAVGIMLCRFSCGGAAGAIFSEPQLYRSRIRRTKSGLRHGQPLPGRVYSETSGALSGSPETTSRGNPWC